MNRSLGLHQNFDIMMDSRKLANELQFKWLAENEIIYFLARKHVFLLARSMVTPVLLIFPALLVIWFAFLIPLPAMALTVGGVGGFVLVLDILWGIWRWVDWGNDYYIVTNQRVIWLEKVVGLYDSRTEARHGHHPFRQHRNGLLGPHVGLWHSGGAYLYRSDPPELCAPSKTGCRHDRRILEPRQGRLTAGRAGCDAQGHPLEHGRG